MAGARVLLIEDTWASGANALSAASTLLAAGAHVVITPIIRAYDHNHWQDERYLAETRRPWDPAEWPR